MSRHAGPLLTGRQQFDRVAGNESSPDLLTSKNNKVETGEPDDVGTRQKKKSFFRNSETAFNAKGTSGF